MQAKGRNGFIILLFIAFLIIGSSCSTSPTATLGTDQVTVLRLAHNHGESHPVHQSLKKFAELVEEKTDGKMKVDLYAGGKLGSEREVIELLQAGSIQISKVSASALEPFANVYSIFSLPYIFESKEHYYEVMDSSYVQEIYQSTKNKNFKGLTFYDAGSRNIYTRNKKVESPDDLAGMKIRVQPSPTTTKMISLMGGAPTPMSYGEVFTSLQSGVVDGAENNEMALTTDNHGEVAKAYTYTEHAFVPDVLIINHEVWDKLPDNFQTAITEASIESTEYHKVLWEKETENAKAKAKEKGVSFYEIDKSAFEEAVQPMHESFKQDKELQKVYENFRSLAENGS
ncbi:TRAP transporter substrate-binding protein [Metabacillus arenae]|uniref:TRAP transporter substrate-binding protein n=1 Tax=Metabacillus arenae TaxID=2771434 RepID=A0A926NKQ9_9BACI|nr:TRAP transporter substrate-binding protein [Metabacillus arenae]MBD1382545.1 TRAP transporter substrate-binding protein [Metabacillus arenae]